MELHIPYSDVTTARFVWNDDQVQACVEPFTNDGVEFDPNNLSNVGMILDLAQAAAASVYGNMLDYIEGSLTTTGDNKDPKILGNIKAIESTVFPTGDVLTSFAARPDFSLSDAATFLTDETKAALMRLKLI